MKKKQTKKYTQNKSHYKAGKSQKLSPETLRKYQQIEKHDLELFKQVKDKQITINKAYNKLKNQEKRKKIEEQAANIPKEYCR